jgi:hypothetical protein
MYYFHHHSLVDDFVAVKISQYSTRMLIPSDSSLMARKGWPLFVRQTYELPDLDYSVHCRGRGRTERAVHPSKLNEAAARGDYLRSASNDRCNPPEHDGTTTCSSWAPHVLNQLFVSPLLPWRTLETPGALVADCGRITGYTEVIRRYRMNSTGAVTATRAARHHIQCRRRTVRPYLLSLCQTPLP